MTLAKSIDYEKVQNTQFVVVAVDNEQPKLSSTATVRVKVININDMSPQFGQVCQHLILKITDWCIKEKQVHCDRILLKI